MLRITPEDIISGKYNSTQSNTAPPQQQKAGNLLVTPQKIMAQTPQVEPTVESQNIIKNFTKMVLGYSKDNTAKRAGVESYDQLNAPAKLAGAMATPIYAARDAGKAAFNMYMSGARGVGEGYDKIRALSEDAELANTLVTQNTQAIKTFIERRDSAPDAKKREYFDKLIKKYQSNTQDIIKGIKTDLTPEEKRALAGSVVEMGVDVGTAGLTSVAKGLFKAGTKQTVKKTALKQFIKSPVGEAAQLGAVYGATGKMREEGDHNAKDYAKSMAIGGAMGYGLGKGVKKLGDVFSKYKAKQKPIVKEKPKVAKIKSKPIKPIEETAVMKHIKSDKTFKINEKSALMTPEGKKATGRYQFDFKKKVGKADIKKGAKPGTVAHEYAHHANYKLGEFKDKFTNKLTKAIRNNEKLPALKGYDQDKLYQEMRKASRLGGKTPKNTSEEFADAVKNFVVRQDETTKTAPEFSRFVRDKVFTGKKAEALKLYHGTQEKNIKEFKGITYFTTDPKEALGFANNNHRLGQKTKGAVIEASNSLKKTKDVTMQIREDLMDGDVDLGIKRELEKAKKQGYDSISFEHPSNYTDGEFKAIVPVDSSKIKPLNKQNSTSKKVKGKKIKWTSDEDKAVEDYIRTKKGINKARPESAKLMQHKDKPTPKFLTTDNTPTLKTLERIKQEIKKPSLDGKEKLQIPTGETAMNIEGLGEPNYFSTLRNGEPEYIKKEDLKVGLNIGDERPGGDGRWIITEVLEDGKFKAMPQNIIEKEGVDITKATPNQRQAINSSSYAEQFDISGKVDTKNPIYRFYEKTIQKYLKKIHPEMKRIKDENGVEWFEINPTKKEGLSPVPAFRKAKEKILGKDFTENQVKKISNLNKKIFGDDNIKITHQILTPEGQNALGVYHEGMIKILKGQADVKDTYYHEVVHKYLDVMTTMSEHKEALIAAKRHFKVNTFDEAEEKLAEAFIGYANKREGFTGAIKTLFDKVIRRVKAVNNNKAAIEQFYGQIVERKYNPKTNTKPISPKNTPTKFVKRKVDKTKYTEKLNTHDSVQNLVKKLEKSDEVQREIQKRGVVSWKETTKQANSMGLDLKGIKSEAKTASDFAARVEAIKQTRANKATELHDFLSNVPRKPTESQKADIARKIDEFLFVDRSLKSISTEHGRAINILKKEVLAQEFETYNKLIDDILEIDPAKASELEYVKAVDKVAHPAMGLITNILNFPRSIMATADLSAPLRQGVFLINHPKRFAKSFTNMFRYAFSEKAYEKSMAKIEKMDTYGVMRKNGLALMDLTADASKREEAIMSNLPERIWGFGKIARGSNRAYTGFLNELRAGVFEDLYKKADMLGITKREKMVKDLAGFVNAASGRGDIPMFTRHAEVLNSVFFSPRLIASRIQLLNGAYYYKLDPFVRKEALKSLFTFASAGATVLSLAKIGGAEVGMDPRSSDFGKIKIGDTRFDIFGGFQQYIVLVSRLITNEMVSSTTGREYDLGEGYKPTTRGTISLNFLGNKLSPVASFAKGLYTGQSFMGEEFDIPTEVVRRNVPIVMADMYDLLKDDKVHYAIPAMFGVGVQNYTEKIPFNAKTPTGRKKVEWRQRPDLADDLVDMFRGKEVSSIPKSQWHTLYKKKMDKAKIKADISNAKKQVLRTGKPTRIHGKRIYLKNGIVKVK